MEFKKTSRLYFISCSPGNMVLTFNTKKSLSLSAGVKIILLRKEDISHVPFAHFDKVLSLKALITTDGKLFNFFLLFFREYKAWHLLSEMSAEQKYQVLSSRKHTYIILTP